MDYQNLAFQIHQFIHNLFGSRVLARCEEELIRVRGDAEIRLLEKDRYLSELKEEIHQLRSKCAQYEMVLIPLVSPAGNLLSPKRPPPTFEPVIEPTSWEAEQQRWYRKQERLAAEEATDGVQEQDRRAPVE